MLIPTWFYTCAFYGCLGLGGLALVYYAYRPPRDDVAGNLPPATVVAPPHRRVLRWLPLACLLGGPLGAWLLNHWSHDVIVVEDGNDGPHASRRIGLGEPSRPRAPGTQSDAWGYDRVWVLNDSTGEVRIETQRYGGMSMGGIPPTVIPPGTALTTYSIDHLGPADRPPETIEVEGLEAKVNMSSRSWLTWDSP